MKGRRVGEMREGARKERDKKGGRIRVREGTGLQKQRKNPEKKTQI